MNKPSKVILLCALWVAGYLSLFASASPDGLEKVGEEQGFLTRGTSIIAGIIPDYAVPGIPHDTLAASLAGIIGTCSVFFILAMAGYFIFKPRQGNTLRDEAINIRGGDK